MSELYPLKFTSTLKENSWGGTKLRSLLNKKGDENKRYGESIEISGIEDEETIVSNGYLKGNSVNELLEIYMGDLVGESIYDKYGLEFPLSIKFIDSSISLPTQVHPDDKTAMQRHKAYGKTRMLHILSSEKDSYAVTGLKNRLEKHEIISAIEENRVDKELDKVMIQKGDTIFVKPTVAYSISKGVLAAVVEQASDITYDLSNSEDKELVASTIDSSTKAEIIDSSKIKQNTPLELINSKQFTSNLIKINQDIEQDSITIDSFIIYICLSGAITIKTLDSEPVQVNSGETVLIPASIDNYTLSPSNGSNTTILEIYIK